MATCSSSGGSKGKTAAIKTGAGKIDQSKVTAAAKDYVTHHLYGSEEYATVDEAKVISLVDKDGYADVEVKYHTSIRIDLGVDPETGEHEYESDTEYRKSTYRLKIK